MKRIVEAFCFFLAIYGGVHAIPASWLWYDVDYVAVQSGSAQPLQIEFSRQVKRDFRGAYSVVVRTDATVVCDASGGPFTYKGGSRGPKVVDMKWWAPSDPRCVDLPADTPLTMETCWTVLEPFWGWWPSKRLCVASDPFEVTGD